MGEHITRAHAISVVVPVYQGETTLDGLLAELQEFVAPFTTPDGHRACVTEVLLVSDNGPDDSARVIRTLEQRYPVVRGIWLSRNFGQHPATMAGMASSGGDWIVTMDEDGQHDPAAIPHFIDAAMASGADVVYAKPTNPAPHGAFRNAASKLAKRLLRLSSGGQLATEFHSYRLVLGEVGRSVAAYAGVGVYLDVALGWVARRVATCPVTLRAEGARASGYNLRSLMSHFWRMVVSSGTRALRIVSLLGVVFALGGGLLAVYVIVAALAWGIDGQRGWASLMVVVLVVGGTILFSLGIVAEYIGVSVNMAMGKPLYVIVSDPADGPLGRAVVEDPASESSAATTPELGAAKAGTTGVRRE